MKLIAFDVDGTVLSTLETIAFHVEETLKENGYKPVENHDFIRQETGFGSYHLIDKCLNYRQQVKDKETITKILDYYTKRYNSDSSYLTEPYEGIVDLLESLKEEGYILVAYSNKPDAVLQPLMKEKFREGLFDYIEGQIDGKPVKPNPQVLETILEKFGVTKQEALYVGDSEVDIATGKNVGIPVVAVSWGFRDKELLEDHRPDYLVDSSQEVKAIIDSLKG